MNDWQAVGEAELLQGIGDGAGDQGGMLGLPFDDHAEGDDRVDPAASCDFLDDQRDLVSAGHFVHDHTEAGRDRFEFTTGVVDESCDEFPIILAGHNGERTPLANLART